MDDRRLTLIVVPHGDLETRTFELSYRRLKLGVIMTGALLVIFVFLAATWFPVAAQAGRVPGLERELARLEGERARVAELAQTLAEVEAQYERVRELLGAKSSADGESILPPLRQDTANSATEETTSTAGVSTRPLSLDAAPARTGAAQDRSGTGASRSWTTGPPLRAAANNESEGTSHE